MRLAWWRNSAKHESRTLAHTLHNSSRILPTAEVVEILHTVSVEIFQILSTNGRAFWFNRAQRAEDLLKETPAKTPYALRAKGPLYKAVRLNHPNWHWE